MSNIEEEYDCMFYPQPCTTCRSLCFYGKCYNCFPERYISCQICEEVCWDGDCSCDEDDND